MRLLVEPKFDLYVDIITSKAKSRANIIQLQWGELSASPPKGVSDFFIEAFDKDYLRYTSPHGDVGFREAIREKLAKKNKITADIENILVTSGGTAAINFAFRVIAGDGGYILIQDPSWFGYPGISNYVGAKTVRLPELKYGYEEFENIYKSVRDRGGELRMIVLNYPSNPTGYVFDEETLKSALDFAEDYGVLLLSDEAYEDYVFSGTHTSIASIKGLEHILSIFTLSKTYAFTGLRIGYAVGPKELIDSMAVAQVHTYISPPSINQYVAMRILQADMDRSFIEENLRMLKHNLKIVMEAIEENGWDFIEPRGGIYAFIRLPRIKSHKFALRLLEEKKVAVAPGVDFGDRWIDWIRITIAKATDEIVEGLNRISQLYRETHHSCC